ncbi:MAG: GntR family transcriptional regulator [Bacteroidota bacterium]
MIEKTAINISFRAEELKPLRDRIVSSIRDSIIEGKIKPGERLMEPEVANMMGVSRTPLREAFLQLESEGFVKVIPRKGAVVTNTSLKDAEETYLIKGALEGIAARLAAEKIADSDLEELFELNFKMGQIAQSAEKDYKAFLELNARFHQKIYESSGNEKLIKNINLLRNQTLRYNFIFLSILSRLDESVEEHFQILNALKERNIDEIEKLVKNHSETARRALCDYMNRQSNSS